jgi:hypothetical protein
MKSLCMKHADCLRVFVSVFAELMIDDGLTLPLKWATLRPQELTPVQFIHLTIDLYGEKSTEEVDEDNNENLQAVWRRSVHVFE